MVFVHDPLGGDPVGTAVLQSTFGLTPAEADLARSLQAGLELTRYARDRRVSLNTVYTHLRRLKDKTGSRRLAELVGKLNGLRTPVRNGD